MTGMDDLDKPLVLIGAGGHAKVALALAIAAGRKVVGICDPALASDGVSVWNDIPVLGDDNALSQLDCSKFELINGIGQLVGSPLRKRIFERFSEAGHHFAILIHPTAWVAPGVKLAEGVQVMAGAFIQPGVLIGENSVINTKASIDHDCIVGAHVHVAPGATLCGSVELDQNVFIGAGAVLIQGLHVGHDAVVGAGVTLTRNLECKQILLGASNRLKVY